MADDGGDGDDDDGDDDGDDDNPPPPSAALSYMRVGAADTPRQKHALLDTTQASPSVPQAPGVAPPHVPLCQWTSKNHCDHLGQQVAVG